MMNLGRQPGSRRVWWYLAMPKPAIVNAVNTPIAYSGTRLLTSASLMISSATEVTVEQDDRVGEHQPVPALEQPAGQERVARHVAGQEREAVEAGVAAGVEDQHGRELHQQEQRVADERAAEDDLGFLGEHRRVAGQCTGWRAWCARASRCRPPGRRG